MENYNPNKIPKKTIGSLQIDISKFEKASDEEKAQHDVMRESTTFFRDGIKKLRRNPLAMLSLVLLIIIVLVIVIAPSIVPYGYSDMISVNGRRDKTAKNLSPFEYSKMEKQAMEEGQYIFPHIFGTDALSRDYFIRVVYGTRVSLIVGFFASVIVLIIGLIYGSISGYIGGKTDLIMMRIVDVIYSLPDTLMVILL
ncbi:MAG: ABC transporter permease, partial [Christensenellaceae bacterium]|nr:ABC transporter permease [Christensenellaceae bacterium]